MRDSEAAKVTDANECHVEDQFRAYLLALQPGTRVSQWMEHIPKVICDLAHWNGDLLSRP